MPRPAHVRQAAREGEMCIRDRREKVLENREGDPKPE